LGTLYVPNSISPVNFEGIFKNNALDFSDKRADISFHPKYVAMHPVGLAFYAALADDFRNKGVDVAATINKKIPSIPYLQRMGLFRVLGFEDPVRIKEHEEAGRFIPLMKVRTNEELDTFLKQIDPVLHTTRENSKTIKHVFSELLRNVLEHSESRLGGNVCATYNRKRQKISIGISDAGIGLYNSLRRNHAVASHRDAVLLALRPGVSGTTSRIGGTSDNAGAGLFFTKCIAQSTKNYFVIYSGNAYFKLKLTPKGKPIQFKADPLEDYSTIKDNLPPFYGTLIGIDINIADTEAFNSIMSNVGIAFSAALNKEKRQ
jgi:hypothetical protein